MKKSRLIIVMLFIVLAMIVFSSCDKTVDYSINFQVDNEEYYVISTSGKETINLPTEPSKDGYVFDGWFVDENQWQEEFTSNSFLTKALDVNLTVYAKWALIEYDIEYILDGGQNNQLNPNKYTIEDEVVLQNPSKIGYSFQGWFEDAEFNTELGTILFDGNKVFYAKWKINKYTIAFNSNGGSPISPIVQDYNSNINAPTVPTKIGYTFGGWFTDNNAFRNNYSFGTMPIDGVVLYAKWTANTYTLTYDYQGANGGNSEENKQITFDLAYGDLPAPTKTGYVFKGWFMDNNTFENQITADMLVGISQNQTLYAKWSSNAYVVVFNANTGVGTMSNQEFVYDDSQDLNGNLFEKVGYTFKNWNTQSNGTGTSYADEANVINLASQVNASVVLYAQWTANTYTITYDYQGANGGNSEENRQVTFDLVYGDLPIPTKTGHTFKGWFMDNNTFENEITTETVVKTAQNHTLYAKWKINQYTITFVSNGGNDVDAIIQDYNSEIDEPTEPTRVGYTFGGWFTDNNTFDEEYVFSTMSAEDISLYAKWTPNAYAVVFNANTGVGTMSNQEFIYDDSQNLNDNLFEKVGYTFIGWNTQINGTGTSYADEANVINLASQVNASVVLYAQWTANTYTLTYDYQGANGGNSEENRQVTFDSQYGVLPSPTKTGYIFDGWHTELMYGNEITAETVVEIASNHTIYAQWTPRTDTEYTVKYYLQNIDDENYSIGETEFLTGTTDVEVGVVEYLNKYTGFTYSPTNSIITGIILADGSLVLEIYYTRNVYTITFYSNSGSDVEAITQDYDSEIDVPVEPIKTGYTFDGWFTDNHTFEEKYVFSTMPAEDISLYAKWTPNAYVVVFNANTGVGTMSNQEFVYDDSQDLNGNLFEKVGYTFKNWNTQSNGTGTAYQNQGNVLNLTAEENGVFTLYAQWTANTYTITYDYQGANGGNSEESRQITFDLAYGDLPTPTKTGHTFKGWFMDNNTFENEITTETVVKTAQNHTLYAKWKINQYTITFVSNGGSDVDAIIQDYNSEIDEPTEPTRVGYTFDGWFTDNNTFDEEYVFSTIPAEDISLYAKWIPNAYVVVFNANTGVGTMSNQEFVYDDSQNLNDNLFEKVGYTFIGWNTQINGTGTTYQNQEDVLNLTAEENGVFTLYAQWTANLYTLTYDYQGANGGNSEENRQVTFDSQYGVLPSPTKTGHTFKGWFMDNNTFENEITTETIVKTAQNHTLYAKWKINQYTITFISNGGSNLDSITQDYNSEIDEPTEPTRVGYTFGGWFTDNHTFDEEYVFSTMPAEDISLYAKWNVIPYDISYVLEDGAYNDPNNPATYNIESQTIIFYEASKNGYTFLGWFDELENGTEVKKIETASIGHVVLYARFEITIYTILYENLKEAEHNNPINYTIETTTFELDALTAPEGYTFKGWYDAPTGGNEVEEIIIGTTGNKILYAQWNLIEYTISYQNLKDVTNNNPISYNIETATFELIDLTPPRGYTFEGWFDAEEGGSQIVEIIIGTTGNKILYAQWELVEFKIKYSLTENLPNSNPTSYTIETETFELTPLTGREGYNFVGWYTGRTGGKKVTIIEKGSTEYLNDSDIISLYARWEEIE